MIGGFTSFVVEHVDDDTAEKLGSGVCIGVAIVNNQYQAMILWDKIRTPAPSFHPTDQLIWTELLSDMGSDDDFEDDDDLDDTDEEEIEETNTAPKNSAAVIDEPEEPITPVDGGDFSDDVVIPSSEAITEPDDSSIPA